MSHWLLNLTDEARSLVRDEIAPEAVKLFPDGLNSQTLTYFFIEEIVRLRKRVSDLESYTEK